MWTVCSETVAKIKYHWHEASKFWENPTVHYESYTNLHIPYDFLPCLSACPGNTSY